MDLPLRSGTYLQLLFFFTVSLFVSSRGQDTALVVDITVFSDGNYACFPLIAPLSLSIDWGDGSSIQNFTAVSSNCYANIYHPGIGHQYQLAGNYTVRFDRLGDQPPLPSSWLAGFGTLEGLGIWTIGNVASVYQVTRVISFGDLGIVNLTTAFTGCRLLTEVPPQLPPTVKSLRQIFSNTGINSANISLWQTGNVTDFSYALTNTPFNQPLNGWDVSNATTLAGFFYSVTEFNQSLSSWRFADGVSLDVRWLSVPCVFVSSRP